LENNKSILLFYLPKYSPEYNPIERFWLWLKSKIYGFRSYQDVEALTTAIRKYLWRYREGHLKDKISFNYVTYSILL